MGDIEVSEANAEVRLRGTVVPTSRTEFLAMQQLASAGGTVVSRNDLLREVWGYAGVGDNRVVDNLVYRLRVKLEENPSEPR